MCVRKKGIQVYLRGGKQESRGLAQSPSAPVHYSLTLQSSTHHGTRYITREHITRVTSVPRNEPSESRLRGAASEKNLNTLTQALNTMKSAKEYLELRRPLGVEELRGHGGLLRLRRGGEGVALRRNQALETSAGRGALRA